MLSQRQLNRINVLQNNPALAQRRAARGGKLAQMVTAGQSITGITPTAAEMQLDPSAGTIPHVPTGDVALSDAAQEMQQGGFNAETPAMGGGTAQSAPQVDAPVPPAPQIPQQRIDRRQFFANHPQIAANRAAAGGQVAGRVGNRMNYLMQNPAYAERRAAQGGRLAQAALDRMKPGRY